MKRTFIQGSFFQLLAFLNEGKKVTKIQKLDLSKETPITIGVSK